MLPLGLAYLLSAYLEQALPAFAIGLPATSRSSGAVYTLILRLLVLQATNSLDPCRLRLGCWMT